MKKHNTLLVVVITILFVALLTWILPVTYLKGELISAERAQAGIVNLLSYPGFTFYNFIYVLVYLLAIGGMYSLLNKTGAYRLILEKVADHVKNRKLIWLIITVLIIALVVSFTGFTFEALLILPFIAGVVLLLGYDKMTAGMITIGSISIGVIGTTFSKMIAGMFNEALGTTYTDLIIVKGVLLILCAGILIFNVIRHAKNSEKDKTSPEGFLLPEKVRGSKPKVWPLALILCLFLVVIIVGTIDWNGAFNITFFNDALTDIKGYLVLSKYIVLTVSLLVVLYNVLRSAYKNKKLGKKLFARTPDKFMSKKRLIVTIVFGVLAILALLKIMLEDVFKATDIMTKALETIKLKGVIEGFTFEKLLGNINALGTWTYNDYFAFMLLTALVIKFTYHVKFDDFVESINDGFKTTLYGALVCMLSYAVLMLTSSHPVILTALKPLLQASSGLHILWYPICTFVSALFNTDFTYYQYGVLNLSYATNYFTSVAVYPLVGLITQSMYGLALMVAPTSVTLLFSLSVLDIKYTTWLKKMWLPILEIVLVVFIAFIVVLQFMV